jgi:hypothetical protein
MKKNHLLGPGLGLVMLALTASCSREAAQEPPTPTALAVRIAGDFEKVRLSAEQLARFTTELYARQTETIAGADPTRYAFAPDGAFYKPKNDSGSALWISGVVPITEEVKAVAYLTEPLDAELARVCREQPIIVQSYYNDRHSLNRIYPWMDCLTQYEAKMDIPSFNFYYLADGTHNPAKRGVWVADPYVDPAGRGWMISAIAPVYPAGGAELAGVVGLDITIEKILQTYVDRAVTPFAVVAASGVIVAATEEAIGLMGMPPLKEHKYLQTVKNDTFKPDDYNLLRSTLRPVRSIASMLSQAGEARLIVTLEGRDYTISSARVPFLGWTVLTINQR